MKQMNTWMGVAVGLGLVAVTGFADVVSFTVNQSIPDNDPTGLQNSQTLSGYSGGLTSIQVHLTLTGDPLAFNGDFFVSLQCDNGGYAVLLNRSGVTASEALGYDNNGYDIIFDLGADDVHLYQDFLPSYDGNGRLTGLWGADARNVDPDLVLDTDPRTADLDTFDGIDPNGQWTLFVADMNQNGTATLESWGLDIQSIPEPGTLALLVVSGYFLFRYRRKT